LAAFWNGAIDAGLPHAPGDQLGDLAAEIDDQQLVVQRLALSRRETVR
jgi:hypothetical protein